MPGIFLKYLSFLKKKQQKKQNVRGSKSVIFHGAKLAGPLIRVQTGNPDQSC